MHELTVRGYAQLWLDDVRARAHPSTVVTYERTFRLYIGPIIGDRKLSDVGRPELKALVSRHSREGLSSAMLLRVLSNFFSAAYDDGYVQAQPAQKLWKYVRPREKTEDVRAFTKDELGRFLELSTTEPLYADLFHAMAFSGMRCGEARALIASDVHELERKLDVVRTFSGNHLSTTTKTKAARRIEIPYELAELLGALARGREPSAWLFDRNGVPLKSKAISESFRRIVRRAGLAPHHGTHSLRHTYASNLIQQGVPIVYVQTQLGHQSIQQTVDVYGRWLTLSRADELERFVAGTRSRNIARRARIVRFPAPARTSCSPTSHSRDNDPDSDTEIA